MSDRELTQAEKATNAETLAHIVEVTSRLNTFAAKLLERGPAHDASKTCDPELATFVEMTPKLKGSTYGSDEYRGFLAQMKPALDHHYANNRHHPEHFASGVRGMNLVDLVEMLCDWKAATMRHTDGDILRSIEINTKRFNLSDDLAALLKNTVIDLGWKKRESNRDPALHNEECDHDLPLLDDKGLPFEMSPDKPSRGTCAECGAKEVCVGCRSSDGECYCEHG